jgi:hypothetical protein
VSATASTTPPIRQLAGVRRYATEALFTNLEVLPIENDFYRFYRLTA